MFRLIAPSWFFAFIAVFSIAVVNNTVANSPGVSNTADEAPQRVKATPEVLAFFNESRRSLDGVDPDPKAGMLFQLLGLAVLFDDKSPARAIIADILEIASGIEPAELRTQLYEGISHALCELESYAEAVEVLQRIADTAERYRSQLDVAVKIIFEHEQENGSESFGISDMLRQIISSSSEAGDRNVTALAHSLLGRELARLKNQEESQTAFVEAVKIAQTVEDAQQQSTILQLIIQSQVRYGQLEGAQTTVQAIADPATKQKMMYAFIDALTQYKHYVQAEQFILSTAAAEPQSTAERDMLIQRWVISNIETVSYEQVDTLSALLSEDHRERFLQAVAAHLQKINRDETAVQVSRRLKDPANAGLALLVGKIESYLAGEKYTEAIEHLEASSEDETFRKHFKRQILTMLFDKTRDEAIIPQIIATYTDEEKEALAELREEAVQKANNVNEPERIELLFSILQDQFLLLDFEGAKQTATLIDEQLDKQADLKMLPEGRVMLARLQIELQDKEGAKNNINKLVRIISTEQNQEKLNSLLPEYLLAQTDNAELLRDRLFQIYALSADLLTQAGAPAESSAVLEKAKELAVNTADALQKAEMYFMLSQVIATPE